MSATQYLLRGVGTSRATTASPNTPVLVKLTGALLGKRVTDIACGAENCMALCSDGAIVVWGARTVDAAGNLAEIATPEPTLVAAAGSALAGHTPVEISAGAAHFLIRCADGTLAAMGWNNNGGSGALGSVGPNTWVPRAVNTGAGSGLQGRTIRSISAGDSASCVLCTDGTLVAWGRWNGTTAGASYLPTGVPNLLKYAGVGGCVLPVRVPSRRDR